ncbi:ABC transporter ATP-binding protein [Pediococcus acidilactici]|uniref:ABC transporter ATP-binding protein n=1 Tax=Pediococcus acidilactici TaxID=1254 RepID=UPI002F266559
MQNKLIECIDMKKTYTAGKNKIEILHNINFTVKRNEFCIIVGPSGSGKTTLINILGFLDTEYNGQYLFNGMDYKKVGDAERSAVRGTNIGFVFQNFKLIPNLTAYENIAIPTLYNKGGQALEVDKLLDMVGLHNKSKSYPNELSGGQQQRVAIARALVNKPNLIIADEPTGALDSKTSADIMDIFKTMNQKKTTVVMVTHDENLVKYGNRIVKIVDGFLEEANHENN